MQLVLLLPGDALLIVVQPSPLARRLMSFSSSSGRHLLPGCGAALLFDAWRKTKGITICNRKEGLLVEKNSQDEISCLRYCRLILYPDLILDPGPFPYIRSRNAGRRL
ncbi:hypothetical protein F4860DRAFT_81471 [Xylaria cubensis]|nr:hypothetical protein F4860DRAFT_81471 [Xylaria cubensis]